MLIDWFTVSAQIVNFLILIWLMKKFLYKPVLNAINAREKYIADAISQADIKKREAASEQEQFKIKNSEFEQQREKLFLAVNEEANKEKTRLIEQAKKDIELLRNNQIEALMHENKKFVQNIVNNIQAEVIEVTRRVISDLAKGSLGLEDEIVKTFLTLLLAMEKTEKDNFFAGIKKGNNYVTINSAKELSEQQRKLIEQTLNQMFSTQLILECHVLPELICGIEIRFEGIKVSWNIASYLATLDKKFTEELRMESTP